MKIDGVEVPEEQVIAALQSQGYKIEKVDDEWPKFGANYYVLSHNGNIICNTFGIDDDDIDAFIQGNAYEIYEEASALRDYRAAKQRVIKRLRELDKDSPKVDWLNTRQWKYCVYFDSAECKIYFTSALHHKGQESSLYTTSEEAIKQLIKEMPEDLKTVLTY